MSASIPNTGERDLDALRRAQRAHEPSMEEILASIRSIIADDREAAPPSRRRVKPAAAPAGPQIVYSKDAATPTRPVHEPPARAEAPRAGRARCAESRLETAGGRARRARAPPGTRAAEEPLVSTQTNQAVSAAFDALSASFGAAGRGTRREHDARNPAPDAQGLARRAPAESGRTARARRNPARGARRTLRRPFGAGVAVLRFRARVANAAAGALCRLVALPTLTFAPALALSGRGRRRAFARDLPPSRAAFQARHDPRTRRGAAAPRSARAMLGVAR